MYALFSCWLQTTAVGPVQIQYKTDTMKTEKKSRLRRVLEAVFSADTVYITVYIIIIIIMCVSVGGGLIVARVKGTFSHKRG